MLYDRGFWLLHLICIDACGSNKQTVVRKMKPLWLGASLAVLFTDLMLQIRLIRLISSNRRRDIKCFLTFDWYQPVTGWRYAASTGTIRPSMWSLAIILACNIVRNTGYRLQVHVVQSLTFNWLAGSAVVKCQSWVLICRNTDMKMPAEVHAVNKIYWGLSSV